MNQYNQVPHLTQDTTWESDKTTMRHQKKRAQSSALPHNEQTRKHDKHKNDQQKKYRFWTVSKNIQLEGLNQF